jgi:hypothetical protein
VRRDHLWRIVFRDKAKKVLINCILFVFSHRVRNSRPKHGLKTLEDSRTDFCIESFVIPLIRTAIFEGSDRLFRHDGTIGEMQAGSGWHNIFLDRRGDEACFLDRCLSSIVSYPRALVCTSDLVDGVRFLVRDET